MLKASVLSQLGYSDEAKANYNNVAETIEKFLSTPPIQITIKIFKHSSYILTYEQDRAQIPGNAEQKNNTCYKHIRT